ncbi:MAG TPA: glycosyltransferase, partial [Pirellulales bacterium]
SYLREVMTAFGLSESWALSFDGGRQWVGQSHREVLNFVAESALLIDVMGFLDDPEIAAAAPRRAFLDIDPGVPQMWRALRLADMLSGYDDYVTMGENIGRPGCSIPTCGLDWITTRQPIVFDHWPAISRLSDGAITSVGSWRGPVAPIEYEGRTYGLRVHEFRKFADLPRRIARRCEFALNIHPSETRDLALLESGGWQLVDPRTVAGSPAAYQAYVQNSRAEFMVAKNMYVQSQCGWFSDRSICYLASGKPVLAQDTGIRELCPSGDGLLVFSDLEEAVAAVERLEEDYPRHARAARKVAEDYFDSDRVLSDLLAKLGISEPRSNSSRVAVG